MIHTVTASDRLEKNRLTPCADVSARLPRGGKTKYQTSNWQMIAAAAPARAPASRLAKMTAGKVSANGSTPGANISITSRPITEKPTAARTATASPTQFDRRCPSARFTCRPSDWYRSTKHHFESTTSRSQVALWHDGCGSLRFIATG